MPNLIAAAVREGLYTHVVARRILYYPELKSTMDEAARLADEGTVEGTVVIAERQSAGRGARDAVGFPNRAISCSRYCSGHVWSNCRSSA